MTFSKMVTYILYGGTKPASISDARWNGMVKFVQLRYLCKNPDGKE